MNNDFGKLDVLRTAPIVTNFQSDHIALAAMTQVQTDPLLAPVVLPENQAWCKLTNSTTRQKIVRNVDNDKILQEFLEVTKTPRKTLVIYHEKAEPTIDQIKNKLRKYKISSTMQEFNNCANGIDDGDCAADNETKKRTQHDYETNLMKRHENEKTLLNQLTTDKKRIQEDTIKLTERLNTENNKIFFGDFDTYGTGHDFFGVRRVIKIGFDNFAKDPDNLDKTDVDTIKAKITQADGRARRLNSRVYLLPNMQDVELILFTKHGCNSTDQCNTTLCEYAIDSYKTNILLNAFGSIDVPKERENFEIELNDIVLNNINTLLQTKTITIEELFEFKKRMAKSTNNVRSIEKLAKFILEEDSTNRAEETFNLVSKLLSMNSVFH